MSSLMSVPILPAEKQLDDANWGSFKDTIVSLLRGRGLDGYPLGTILRSSAQTYPGLYVIPTTAANSRTPSQDEWDLRDANAGAIIYQNVVDPIAHGLVPTETSRQMWILLSAKFNRTSEVLKGLAVEKLRALKLANGRGLPAHLDALTKLRAEQIID
ncbi:hypothetical protein DFH09DRAFT_1339776 [Mycena vulgaris]|nr:hypothetical protein DFH09DRAFT_1339776 [Mycena vulgaris]